MILALNPPLRIAIERQVSLEWWRPHQFAGIIGGALLFRMELVALFFCFCVEMFMARRGRERVEEKEVDQKCLHLRDDIAMHVGYIHTFWV